MPNIPASMTPELLQELREPLKLARLLWPHARFYDRQREVIRSVVENKETFVPAGHQLGKDYVTGFVALWYFLVHPVVRVITTSVKDDHLRVLWGEIGRFVTSSAVPLDVRQGGPLVLRHRDIRKVVAAVTPSPHGTATEGGNVNGRQGTDRSPQRKECDISYLRGMVSEKGEGLAGHHAPATLMIVDEASGVDDEVYDKSTTWAKRLLVIGNPYSSGKASFFERFCKQGDVAGSR